MGTANSESPATPAEQSSASTRYVCAHSPRQTGGYYTFTLWCTCRVHSECVCTSHPAQQPSHSMHSTGILNAPALTTTRIKTRVLTLDNPTLPCKVQGTCRAPKYHTQHSFTTAAHSERLCAATALFVWGIQSAGTASGQHNADKHPHPAQTCAYRHATS